MNDLLVPANEVTFTVTGIPRREAERKTIERLMWRQPSIQKGMKMLQKRRKKKDNITYIRAGVEWVNRKRATRLCRATPGTEFTLRISPKIIPDLQSVSKYLDAKKA
jgi:hypothetical protein